MFITTQTTYSQLNTTQVYLDSTCAFTSVLHVLVCTQDILRHVNTKNLIKKDVPYFSDYKTHFFS